MLFDPYTGGSDFVEFFNASNSNIDLYHYFVADYDASDGEISNYKQITGHHVISPSDVVCFTEDTSSTISECSVLVPSFKTIRPNGIWPFN